MNITNDIFITYGLFIDLMVLLPFTILLGVTMLGKALKVTAFGLCAMLPLSSYANNFNYNTTEFRIGTGPRTFGTEFTTYYTDNSHFVVRADSEISGDWDLAAGVGFNGPAGQFADIYGQMLVHGVKESDNSNIEDDWLTEVNIGTRMWFMEGIELHARLGQLMGSENSRSLYSIGARFHSTQQLSVGADFKNHVVYGQQMVMSVRFGY